MKTFRHLIIPVFLTLSAFALVLTIGCKNKCGSTTCQNGGACESNVCVCATGYSGNSCQTSWSGVALGTYNCTRSNCKPTITAASWQSVVTTDATNGGYSIDISNFDNSNTTIVAIIDSARYGISGITISNISGVDATGSYDSTTAKINLVYTVYSGGVADYTCNMVMSKIQ